MTHVPLHIPEMICSLSSTPANVNLSDFTFIYFCRISFLPVILAPLHPHTLVMVSSMRSIPAHVSLADFSSFFHSLLQDVIPPRDTSAPPPPHTSDDVFREQVRWTGLGGTSSMWRRR
jgi:hypothetical protein